MATKNVSAACLRRFVTMKRDLRLPRLISPQSEEKDGRRRNLRGAPSSPLVPERQMRLPADLGAGTRAGRWRSRSPAVSPLTPPPCCPQGCDTVQLRWALRSASQTEERPSVIPALTAGQSPQVQQVLAARIILNLLFSNRLWTESLKGLWLLRSQ